jgi:hypothetical protein
MPYQLSLQTALAFNLTTTDLSKILAKRGVLFDREMWGSGSLAVCAPHCDRMMRIAKWNAVATVCIIAKSFGYKRRCTPLPRNVSKREATVIGAGVVGLSAALQLLRRNFSVDVIDELPAGEGASFGRLNLWWSPTGTDCYIHNEHPFIEIHTQIHGAGRIQKFQERNDTTLYEQISMAPGIPTTHLPTSEPTGRRAIPGTVIIRIPTASGLPSSFIPNRESFLALQHRISAKCHLIEIPFASKTRTSCFPA